MTSCCKSTEYVFFRSNLGLGGAVTYYEVMSEDFKMNRFKYEDQFPLIPTPLPMPIVLF